ncbi:MAG: hypothetical protein K2P78_10140 [Gemmataceae bacterium]|nr:hypothetical protein [Gemmataceae bacterium]
MMVFLGIMCVGLLIGLAITIFYILTLTKALNRVRPELRDLEPGQVWLVLIPFFNLYWNFVIAQKVPSSLENEFRERGMHTRGEDYGAGVGKWYAICSIASIVPFVNYVAGPAGLICLILFWVKIAGFSKQLAEDGGGGDEDDDRPRRRSRRDEEDDDEDDRPRRRRRRDDDDYDD